MVLMLPASGDVSEIFRGYDIRGVYGKTLDQGIAKRIGQALASTLDRGGVAVARDARLSGQSLEDSFISGLLSGGCPVVEMGMLPIGAAMFHAWQNRFTLGYVTASHLEREWNGFKFFGPDGTGYMENQLEAVRKAFLRGNTGTASPGSVKHIPPASVEALYTSYVTGKIRPSRRLRVALDPGHGAAGHVSRALFSRGGFDVSIISEEPDGRFPARSPDPGSDSLGGLSKLSRKADLGIAYDGDGDRMVILDEKGARLSPEQISFILLSELLKEQKGPIVANVEVSRTIDIVASRFKRKVHRIKVGHNHLIKNASVLGACFGMEPSGHYTAPWIFPFDDSLAISYYFASTLSRLSSPLSELAAAVPRLPFQRFSFKVDDSRKFKVMERLTRELRKAYPRSSTLDGIRVDMDRGWALVRPSNTEPIIRLTVEADTQEDFEKIRAEFASWLEKFINT